MLVANKALVLAINGANMAIFSNRGKALHVDLEPLEESHQPVPETAELGRDRPGRSFESAGVRRSGYETHDLHTREEDRFIKQGIDRLEELAAKEGRPVIVIAPPDALGAARKMYSAELRKLVVEEIDKDYSTRPANDVSAFLASFERG
jgi:protein required for attachment to host cells